MNSLNELIGRRLKYAREKLGLTQAQLSERLGFKDRQTLAAIEAGQRKVTAEELVRAAEALKVDIDFFNGRVSLNGRGEFLLASRKRDHRDSSHRQRGWTLLGGRMSPAAAKASCSPRDAGPIDRDA
jgi:transcriptional regulator with XRE-family HTH domain